VVERVNSLDTALRGRKLLSEHDPLPPPASWEAVHKAEDRLGFRLPPLLCRLWAEIANGGFGPGYGLLGLDGGHVDELQRLSLPDLYLSTIEDEGLQDFSGEPWPRKLVPICDWGCRHQSAIDCTTLKGEIVDLWDGYERRPRGVTFRVWMENWVEGLDPWDPR
jgi:hypothetical protein